MKRKILTGFFAVVIFALGAGSAFAQANFSGEWALDKSKSEGLPPNYNPTMTITQTGDRVEVVIKATTPQGEEQTIRELYILSGKEVDFKPALRGGGTAKSGKRISTRTADGNGFEVTEEATIDGPEGEATIKATRLMTLSADGKTLTSEISFDTPNGKSKTKRVFVKR